jgi:hypothetical protein
LVRNVTKELNLNNDGEMKSQIGASVKKKKKNKYLGTKACFREIKIV